MAQGHKAKISRNALGGNIWVIECDDCGYFTAAYGKSLAYKLRSEHESNCQRNKEAV